MTLNFITSQKLEIIIRRYLSLIKSLNKTTKANTDRDKNKSVTSRNVIHTNV